MQQGCGEMTGGTCSSCVFYLADGSVCCRYPPSAEITWLEQGANHQATAYSTTSFFAPMKPDGWCGEFSAVKRPFELD